MSKRKKKHHVSVWTLIRRALASYVRALPVIAVVGLIGAIPMQLAVTWLLSHQGIGDDAVWELRYQGLADWLFGSLISPAVFLVIHRSIVEASRGERTGVLVMLGWAYRRALSVWLGTFLTRMMVSFAVVIPGLPVLGGLYLIQRRWPALGEVVTDPSRVVSLSPGELAPLLLMLPLLAPPVYFFLRYALAEVVVALERTDGFEALQRSKALTLGARSKLLVAMVVLDGPVLAVGLGIEGLADSVSPWAGSFATAFSMVLAALPGTFLVHVYLAQGGDAVDRRTVAAPTASIQS
jgi:hypothetical protein